MITETHCIIPFSSDLKESYKTKMNTIISRSRFVLIYLDKSKNISIKIGYVLNYYFSYMGSFLKKSFADI